MLRFDPKLYQVAKGKRQLNILAKSQSVRIKKLLKKLEKI